MIVAFHGATVNYNCVYHLKRSLRFNFTFATLKTTILNLVKTSLFLLGLLCMASCFDAPQNRAQTKPAPGKWVILFDAGQAQIPVILQIDSSNRWSIHNDGESIDIKNITLLDDSFHVKLPLFQTFLHGQILNDTTLRGFLHDPTRSADYKIPFVATLQKPETLSKETTAELIYDCTFSPADTAEMYKAVGIFHRTGENISGTFLTETGDYRFLGGKVTGDSLRLSCFDGAHLFFFRAQTKGDSIVGGTFYSGKHWSEPWNGRLDPNAAIRDPELLTSLNSETGEFRFRVQNLSGDSVIFSHENFRNKVTLVQIMGSWCPNCTDESLLLKQLYEKYSSLGLQVIPVGFERSENFEENARVLKAQWDELGMPYPPFVGAGKGKAKAEETFPMLNHVMSFPTCIIIDKEGKVRKIHTGFYGPGTGNYYLSHANRLDIYIKQLLDEQL